MVRVPTFSKWGGPLGEADQSGDALRQLSEREVGLLIKRCAAALKEHGTDFHRRRDKENALAVFESTMVLLLEVRDLHPSHRADIDAVLVRFGYPVQVN